MEQCIDLALEIEDESLLGDLNLDGTINIVDIVMLVGVVNVCTVVPDALIILILGFIRN